MPRTRASRPQTPAPTDGPPLTLDVLNSVRFNISEPAGYHFPQVENVVEQMKVTLKWHEGAAFTAAQTIHQLREEIAEGDAHAANLQAQIEIFRVQGDALVHPDGSYMTESELGSTDASAQQASDLQAQIDALTQHNVDLNAHIDVLTNHIADEQARAATDLAAALERAAAAETARGVAEAATESAGRLVAETEEHAAALLAQVAELQKALADRDVVPGPDPSGTGDAVEPEQTDSEHRAEAAEVDEVTETAEVDHVVADAVPDSDDAPAVDAPVVDVVADEQAEEHPTVQEPADVTDDVEVLEQDVSVAAEPDPVEQVAVPDPLASPGVTVARQPLGQRKPVSSAPPAAAPVAPVSTDVDSPSVGEPEQAVAAGPEPVTADAETQAYVAHASEPRLASSGTVTLIPVDSELPEGTVLPPRDPDAGQYTYNEAGPGAPLTSVSGLPLEEWAPELVEPPTRG